MFNAHKYIETLKILWRLHPSIFKGEDGLPTKRSFLLSNYFKTNDKDV